jgi:hypothetical protein
MGKHLQFNKIMFILIAFFCGMQMGWAYEPDFSKKCAFNACSTISPITIPNPVTSIGNGWCSFTNLQDDSCAVVASANPTDGGSVSGTGNYYSGEICTLTATANTGYTFANWTENDSIVSTDNIFSFIVTENHQLVANFSQITNHWTPVTGMSGSMTISAILKIDGVEPLADYLEIGAFSGEECRGSALPMFDQGYCLYSLSVVGNTNGDTITFRLFDHHLDQELDLFCTNELSFQNDLALGFEELYEFNFISSVQITATANPTAGGTVSGGGTYEHGSNCTLTATPNTGYVLLNWTKDGNVVSTSPTYTFTVTEAGEYVANFGTYADEYFTIESLAANNTVTFSIPSTITSQDLTSVSYSTDKISWNTLTINNTNQSFSVTLNMGEKLYLKGTGNRYAKGYDSGYYCNFSATGNYVVYGNIMSLLYGDDFASHTSFPTNSNYVFGGGLFKNNTTLVSAENMVLPATAMVSSCYHRMFSGCTSLTAAPSLPATTLASFCYNYMFNGCTSLTVAPALPATTLANYCYQRMFSGCTSLTAAPSLPATTLASSCYNYMFNGCTSLTVAPALPATTLANYCYQCMFSGCSSLNTVTCFATDISATNCTTNWLSGVAATGTFQKNPEMDGWTLNSPSGIPTGWTIQCDYDITASANPTAGGTVSGAGTYAHGVNVTLTATPATGYTFVNWTKNGTQVSTNATYSFTASANGNYVANFSLNSYTIGATADPNEGGTIEGAGTYNHFATCTLTATPADNFIFNSWVVDGEIVSTETTYTFEVSGPVTVTAVFDLVQVNNLDEGWTWWSASVELNDIEGLEMLENSLGELGLIIKTQNAYVQYFPSLNQWTGTLTQLHNEQGYKVKVSGDCTATMIGPKVYPSDHPIAIQHNWNWIGYPSTEALYVTDAMANFQPENGDIIKSQGGFATYYTDLGWVPSTFSLNPGNTFLFFSNSEQGKSLTFGNGGRTVVEQNDERHWSYNPHAFADNLCLTAVVTLDGEEQHSETLELGAFVDGECRGSAKLLYIEPLDRYFALMTIAGLEDEQVSFALFDEANGLVSNDSPTQLSFSVNAIIGEFDDPFVVHFGDLTSLSEQAMHLGMYPNPVNCNETFRILIPQEETVAELTIVNTLGSVVRHESGAFNRPVVEGLPVSGVYLVRVVCKSGNVYLNRLVVK